MTQRGLPGNIVDLLASADRRNGFPAGTMAAVMQQEVGGQLDRFLTDPSTPHYTPDAQGRRKSSAFGPFGILESTAAEPGYGVAPLKDRSLEEQVRFAADYLAARSKAGGGLTAGLAGYGEGNKYATQVVNRIGGGGPDGAREQVAAAPPAPTLQAQAPVPAPVQVAAAPAAAEPAGPDAWQQFIQHVAPAQPVHVASMAYGPQVAPMPGVMQPRFAGPAMPSGQVGNWGAAPAMPAQDAMKYMAMRGWIG